MSTNVCSCENFDRLAGASVQAYTKQFLEKSDDAPDAYLCRVCGARWQRREAENKQGRAELVKVENLATN